MQLFGQRKVYSVETSLFIMEQKRQWDARFFPIFNENHCSHAQNLSKNVHSLKKQTALISIFCQTNVLSKTLLCSHVIFFNIVHNKTPTVMPRFGQNTSILSNFAI